MRISIPPITNIKKVQIEKSVDDSTYLVMLQLHPREQVPGHRENVAQHIDLEFVEGLVNIGFQQRF